MATESAVRERVLEFLGPRLNGHRVADDENIFDLGFVNSLFAMQLLRFIEVDFDISLQSEDLKFENFQTVERIVQTVLKKRLASGM
ncbi:acyl carrier protein [Actinomadura chokoriensis]|uniref:Acyl carrier protein n=1 Tax=Actinomadura chokoriensis TaxID=454156 RepID=A0ABV4QYT4_9ACTN